MKINFLLTQASSKTMLLCQISRVCSQLSRHARLQHRSRRLRTRGTELEFDRTHAVMKKKRVLKSPMFCTSLLITLGLLTILPLDVATAGGAPEIWLSGISPGVRLKMFQESQSDYFELFKPDAAWSKSAQQVKVFMINGGLLLRQS